MSGLLGPDGQPATPSVPIDPANPLKGNVTPVFNAQQLTAMCIGLDQRQDVLLEAIQGISQLLRDTLSETAEMLEHVSRLVAADELALTEDEQDESVQYLREYAEGRANLRAELEAQAALGRDEEGGTFNGEAPQPGDVPGPDDRSL